MRHPLAFIALCTIALLSGAAEEAFAHARSVSYSRWEWNGVEAEVLYRIDSRTLAEIVIGPGLERGAIGPAEFERIRSIARRFVLDGVHVTQRGITCEVSQVGQAILVDAGRLRLKTRYRCPEPVEQAGVEVRVEWLTSSPAGHTHLMQASLGGRLVEAAFGELAREWRWEPAEAKGNRSIASALTFLRDGIWHILIGYDHIAFLVTLLLIVSATTSEPRRMLRDLFFTATSFTVGHSITLALAALGIVDPERGTVEFLIALSIIATASEGFLIAQEWTGCVSRLAVQAFFGTLPVAALLGLLPHSPLVLTGFALFAIGYFQRIRRAGTAGWLRGAVALVFGLVHGFGFAGVLKEMGLEGPSLLVSLLSFNLGVETGQAGIILLLIWPLAHIQRSSRRAVITQLGYATTFSLAMYWLGLRS